MSITTSTAFNNGGGDAKPRIGSTEEGSNVTTFLHSGDDQQQRSVTIAVFRCQEWDEVMASVEGCRWWR